MLRHSIWLMAIQVPQMLLSDLWSGRTFPAALRTSSAQINMLMMRSAEDVDNGASPRLADDVRRAKQSEVSPVSMFVFLLVSMAQMFWMSMEGE